VKILLINPPRQQTIRGEIEDNLSEALNVYPPLGLAYLKAVVEQAGTHEVILADLQFPGYSQVEVAHAVRENAPDLVGVSVLTHNILDVKETLLTIKRIRPDAICVLGGPHIDVFPAESIELQGAQLAMYGECEKAFPLLLDALTEARLDLKEAKLKTVPQLIWKDPDGQIIINENTELPLELDDLPFPAAVSDSRYHGPLESEPVATILSSRGCPFRCVFCSTPHVYYRARSPESIIAEMKFYRNAGVRHFYFVDDVFNITADRVKEFSRALSLSGLKATWSFRARVDAVSKDMFTLAKLAGAERIQFGVETSTDEGLSLIGKNCSIDDVEKAFRMAREAGILTVAYFILGCPHEKHPNDVRRTVDFAISLDPDYAVFNAMAIFPGTRIHDLAVESGVIRENTWSTFAAKPEPGFQVPLWTLYFSAAKLRGMLKEANHRFYYRPKVVMRELQRVKSFGDLVHKAKVALNL